MDMMGSRAQVLANCKFLYGPDIELLSLGDKSTSQAIVASFDHSTGLTSVFLRSKPQPCTGTHPHVLDLLHASEREIVKRFSQDGIKTPLDGEHNKSYYDLYMPLHRKIVGSRRSGTSIASDSSGSSFADTPASSIAGADTGVQEFLGNTDQIPQSAGSSDGAVKGEIEQMHQTSTQRDSTPQINETKPDPGQENVKSLADPTAKPTEPLTQSSQFAMWEFGAKNKTKDGTTAVHSSLMNELVADVRLERQERNAEITEDDAGAKWKSTWTTTTEELHSNYLSEEGKKTSTKKVTISPVSEVQDVPVSQSKTATSDNTEVLTKKVVIEEPMPDINPGGQECTTDLPEDDLGWCSFKKPKKSKKKVPKIGESVFDFLTKPAEPVDNLNRMYFSQEGKPELELAAYDEVPSNNLEITPEPEPATIVDDDWGSFVIKKRKKKETKTALPDDAWGFATTKKDKKKKGKIAIVDGPAEEVQQARPDREVEDDFWGSLGGTKEKKKKSKRVVLEEPLTKPKLKAKSISEEWNKGSLSGEKENSKKDVVEPSIPEPNLGRELERELEAAIEEDGWSAWSSKKDKKKQKIVVDTPLPEPQPRASVLDEDRGSGSFDVSKKAKKNIERTKIEIESSMPLLEPEGTPACEPEKFDDSGWGTFPSKKDKKKKKCDTNPPVSESESEPEANVVDFKYCKCYACLSVRSKYEQERKENSGVAWAQRSSTEPSTFEYVQRSAPWETENPDKETSKRTERVAHEYIVKERFMSGPIIEDSEYETVSDVGSSYLSYSSCFSDPMRSNHNTSIPRPRSPPPPAKADLKNTNDQTHKGHPVVLKLLCRNLLGEEETLRGMVKLWEDTPKEILNAATSLIDMVKNNPKRQQWNFRILRATGKDGMELVLMRLGDSWAECLEYLRQYTKIPELTVEAVEIEV